MKRQDSGSLRRRAVCRPGPASVGQHNEQVLSDLLGMDADEIARLAADGVLS